MKHPKHSSATSQRLAVSTSPGLLQDIRELILTARTRVAQTFNSVLVTLHWQIGNRIRRDILKEKRAKYGDKIVSALGRQLEIEFGTGFSEKSLRHMIRFTEAFPDDRIVSALRRQLSWTHFKHIIYLDDPLKRDFYAEMCRLENWSTRTLEKKIGSMLFERTALSRKPAKLAEMELKQLREEDKLSPDLVFRDPYFLDFLGLRVPLKTESHCARPSDSCEKGIDGFPCLMHIASGLGEFYLLPARHAARPGRGYFLVKYA